MVPSNSIHTEVAKINVITLQLLTNMCEFYHMNAILFKALQYAASSLKKYLYLIVGIWLKDTI